MQPLTKFYQSWKVIDSTTKYNHNSYSNFSLSIGKKHNIVLLLVWLWLQIEGAKEPNKNNCVTKNLKISARLLMTIRVVSNRPWSQDYGGQNLVRKNDLLLKSWIFENRVYCFPIDGLAFLAVAINNQSALHQIILGFYEFQRYCNSSFFLIRWVKFIWRGTHIETLKQKLPYNQYRKFSGGCTGITIFDVLLKAALTKC